MRTQVLRIYQDVRPGSTTTPTSTAPPTGVVSVRHRALERPEGWETATLTTPVIFSAELTPREDSSQDSV